MSSRHRLCFLFLASLSVGACTEITPPPNGRPATTTECPTGGWVSYDGDQAVVVCNSAPNDIAPPQDLVSGFGKDQSPDQPLDLPPETADVPDTAVDLAPDIAPDVAPETTPDVSPDTAPDTADLAPDLPPEEIVDVPPDTPPVSGPPGSLCLCDSDCTSPSPSTSPPVCVSGICFTLAAAPCAYEGSQGECPVGSSCWTTVGVSAYLCWPSCFFYQCEGVCDLYDDCGPASGMTCSASCGYYCPED